MKQRKILNKVRRRRIARVRVKVLGTAERPRLALKRSARHIYAQLIDDLKGHTLAAASSRDLETSGQKTKTDIAKTIGELLAKRAKEKGIQAAVLDRRSYKYHGRVKALAEGARSSGLKI